MADGQQWQGGWFAYAHCVTGVCGGGQANRGGDRGQLVVVAVLHARRLPYLLYRAASGGIYRAPGILPIFPPGWLHSALCGRRDSGLPPLRHLPDLQRMPLSLHGSYLYERRANSNSYYRTVLIHIPLVFVHAARTLTCALAHCILFSQSTTAP